MTTETAATIITITLAINCFLLGMLSYLHGWPQLKKPTHTDIKAAAWEDGFAQGADYYYEGNSKPTDFTETAQTLNPHKETN